MANQQISVVPSHVSLPDNYVRPEAQRPRLHEVIAGTSVPTIDLNSPDLIGKIADAFTSYGCFQVVNHGVDYSVPEMLEVSSEFFQLPAEEKGKYYSDDPMKKMRLSTSSNVRTEMAMNWRDYLRLPCYLLEEFVPSWPSNPPSFKHLFGEDLSPLDVNELELLKLLVESALSQTRKRETQLMREQMEELGKKLIKAAVAGSSFSVQANRNMDRAPTPSIRHFLGEDLSPLGVKELEQLARKLESTLSQARQKETHLMLEQMEELRKKVHQLEEINKKLKRQIDIAGMAVSTILENARTASIIFEAAGKNIS